MAGHIFLALSGGVNPQNKTLDTEASPSAKSWSPFEIH